MSPDSPLEFTLRFYSAARFREGLSGGTISQLRWNNELIPLAAS
jgi:hypothetical protein